MTLDDCRIIVNVKILMYESTEDNNQWLAIPGLYNFKF